MTQITKFKLSELRNFETIERIVTEGYEKTGLKFSIHFNGSKGYLTNIEISCELSYPVRIDTPYPQFLINNEMETYLFYDKGTGLSLRGDTVIRNQ